MYSLFFSCNKDIFFDDKPKKEVTLHFSFESVKGGLELEKENNDGKGPISSGATIQGPVGYYGIFFLMPADEYDYAEGIFVIKNSIGDTIYKSAEAENGCEYKFSLIGIYTLSVSGIYNEQFSFVNITINITDNSTPPPPTSTIPRLYDFIIEEDNTCRITAVIHKGYYISQSNWFGVKRINGLNFVTNQTVTVDGDSVRYTIEFPAVDQNYVEFNFAVNNGVAGGTWMTPTDETPLYSGYENVPYNSSGSWFGFRLVINSGLYEIRSYSNELILSTGSESVDFPGRNGDDLNHNYTMRWSGYIRWIKTNNTQQIVRYKIAGSSFIYPSTADWTSPLGIWKQFTVLNSTSGEVHYQIGHWTNNVFIADINITSMSKYYEQRDTSFVQIL